MKLSELTNLCGKLEKTLNRKLAKTYLFVYFYSHIEHRWAFCALILFIGIPILHGLLVKLDCLTSVNYKHVEWSELHKVKANYAHLSYSGAHGEGIEQG